MGLCVFETLFACNKRIEANMYFENVSVQSSRLLKLQTLNRNLHIAN